MVGAERLARLNPDLALAWVDQLSTDLHDSGAPPEIRQLGRNTATMANPDRLVARRAGQQRAHRDQRPVQAIKPVAFGMSNFVHWRLRVLLYAGRPDWSKLATDTPT